MTLLTAPPIPAQRSGATEFDRTTTVVPVVFADVGGTAELLVDLDEGWSSLVGVHGGYMCALVVRAAEAVVPDRHVRTMSTGFVRAGRASPGTVEVREVRRGRSVSTVTADLLQHGSLVTTTRLTMTVEQEGIEWAAAEPLGLPPPHECVPVDPPTRVRHFDQATGLLDPESLPFTGGPRARLAGYVRPRQPRPVDTAWLAMAVDWFPPPAFVRTDPPAGGVSIDLTTHFHRPAPELADGEWLAATFEIDESSGGLALEHGRIAGPDGRLLAESFHTRSTARRAGEG
jgi:acyl-CoA thioesterase